MLSLTKIRKALKSVAFNPRVPGPMKVIADVGDCSYFEKRAIEEISYCVSIRLHNDEQKYRENIDMAIRMFILVKVTIDE